MLVAVCALSYWWWGYTNEIVPPPNAGLVVDEKELDFGEVWEDRAFPWKFTIRNSTAKDVEIKKFSTSCGCAKVQPQSITVPAHSNVEVRLTLDLSEPFWHAPIKSQAEHATPAQRPFDATIEPAMNDLILQKGWHVRGHVRKDLTIVPADLRVTDPLVYGAQFPAQKAEVVSHFPYVGIEAMCSPEYAHVDVRRKDDDRYTLDITLNPQLPVGNFTFRTRLKPLVGQNREPPKKSKPSHSLLVHGQVVDDAQTLPSKLLFGPRTIGETVEESVTLASLTGLPITVDSVEVPSAGTVAERVSVDNGLATFIIRQRVAKPGHVAGTVTFRVRKGERRYQHVLPWSYYGIPSAKSTLE